MSRQYKIKFKNVRLDRRSVSNSLHRTGKLVENVNKNNNNKIVFYYFRKFFIFYLYFNIIIAYKYSIFTIQNTDTIF